MLPRRPRIFGGRTGCVFDLVEWATDHPQLDSGHRRGERAWHCMGQKVLSIRTTNTGVAIMAGRVAKLVEFSGHDSAPMGGCASSSDLEPGKDILGAPDTQPVEAAGTREQITISVI